MYCIVGDGSVVVDVGGSVVVGVVVAVVVDFVVNFDVDVIAVNIGAGGVVVNVAMYSHLETLNSTQKTRKNQEKKTEKNRKKQKKKRKKTEKINFFLFEFIFTDKSFSIDFLLLIFVYG